jgi:hypothetical protein
MSVPVTSSQWKVASAWLVSKAHIDLLVAARKGLLANGEVGNQVETWMNKDDNFVGQQLWDENMKSLSERYGADRAPEMFKFPKTKYRFTKPHEAMDPMAVIKQVHVYAYQACEHDGWESSQAKRYCDELEKTLVTHHPAYQNAPWGI